MARKRRGKRRRGGRGRRKRGFSDDAILAMFAGVMVLGLILYYFDEFILLVKGVAVVLCVLLLVTLLYKTYQAYVYLKQQREKDEQRKYKYRNYENGYVAVDDKTMEHLVAAHFRYLGYYAEVTGGPGDRGIDVEMWKDGDWYAVQVKKYSLKDAVSAKEVREFSGAMKNRYKRGFFVTTSRFTAHAREWVRDVNIELVDGAALRDMEIDADNAKRGVRLKNILHHLTLPIKRLWR